MSGEPEFDREELEAAAKALAELGLLALPPEVAQEPGDAIDDLLGPGLRAALAAPGRRTVRNLPRWAVAAALLLAIGTIATGTYLLRKRIGLVSPGRETAGEVASQPPLDLEGAGIPRDALTAKRQRFALPDGRAGLALGVDLPNDRGVDVAAFGPDGRALWPRDADWRRLLRRPGVRFRALESLPTRKLGPYAEETLCVAVSSSGRTGLLFIVPGTGSLLGSCFFPGWIKPSSNEIIGLLPDLSGKPRRVLVAGGIGRNEQNRPMLMVLDLDGSVVQLIRLPVVGVIPNREVVIYRIMTAWRPGFLRVQAISNEGLQYRFGVDPGSRRIDVESAMVFPHDNFGRKFDEKLQAPGAWKRKVAPHGGEQGYFRFLLNQVEEAEPVGFGKGWDD